MKKTINEIEIARLSLFSYPTVILAHQRLLLKPARRRALADHPVVDNRIGIFLILASSLRTQHRFREFLSFFLARE